MDVEGAVENTNWRSAMWQPVCPGSSLQNRG